MFNNRTHEFIIHLMLKFFASLGMGCATTMFCLVAYDDLRSLLPGIIGAMIAVFIFTKFNLKNVG